MKMIIPYQRCDHDQAAEKGDDEMKVTRTDCEILKIVSRERHKIEQHYKESKITIGEYADQIAVWNRIEYLLVNEVRP